MKTMMVLSRTLILISMICLSTSCEKYIQPKIAGCATQNIEWHYIVPDTLTVSKNGLGKFDWTVYHGGICSKMHIPEIEITWVITNSLKQQLESYSGSINYGVNKVPMKLAAPKFISENDTWEITLKEEDLGIKDVFQGEEGFVYVVFLIDIISLGDDDNDMNFLKENWRKCEVKVFYFPTKK